MNVASEFRGEDGNATGGVVQIEVAFSAVRASPAHLRTHRRRRLMTKPHRNLKKANHGSRPANSKARRLKRKHIRT